MSGVTGASSASCASLPFGDDSSCSGSGFAPLQFTGQYHDNATGLDNFKARYDSPVIGQFMTPDPGAPSALARWGGGPAGLAVVDPNDPQTWNRYAYVGGNPLSRIDPLGLQPCNTAALRRPGSDQEADGFGPYSPDEDGAAAQADGDCGAFWNQCSLDGVSMDCDLMQEMDGMSGGGGGESIDWGASSACNWYACPPTVPGQDGNPHQYGWQEVVATDTYVSPSCWSGCTVPTFVKDFYVTYRWADLGPQEPGCGLDMGCQFFSGFVNFFLNDRISGLGQMALGEAGAGAMVAAGAATAEYGPEAARALQPLGQYVYTNPSLTAALSDIASALSPASWPAPTWWGLAAEGGVQTYQRWDAISNWFGGH